MTKHLLIAACLSFASLAPLVLSPARADDDILINDFEAADYGDWKVEGEAFGAAPAKGTLGGQMHVSGFEGKGLVNTFLGGDRPTGTLTSPEFTIERDYIKFLVGGGARSIEHLGRERNVARRRRCARQPAQRTERQSSAGQVTIFI